MVELRLQRLIVHYMNVGMQCGRSRSITNISTESECADEVYFVFPRCDGVPFCVQAGKSSFGK